MALSDYFRPDLFRPRNLVPAIIAVAVVGGAWFTIRQLQPDEPPPPPPEQQAAVPAEVPPPEPPPEAESEPLLTVLVTRRDILQGTTLNRELLDWQERPETEELSAAIIRHKVPVESVLGTVTRRDIAAGELITRDDLVMAGVPGSVAASLSPGYRAIAVAVDDATARAQIIYPGDRVDVVLVHSPGSGGVPAEMGGVWGPMSQVIVRDARVLAAGSATMDIHYSRDLEDIFRRPEPPTGETYTLEVSTLDAERIALAAVAGRLALVVRPVSSTSAAESPSTMPGRDGLSLPVLFSEVMHGLDPPEEDEEFLSPVRKVRIIRGRGQSSQETLESRQAEEAAELLAEALRGG